MKTLRLILAALLCAAFLPAHAASVVPLYLEELVDASAVAFEGTCISNRTQVDPDTGLVVTYTTFTVRDVLKGSAAMTHVIKQIGGSLPGESVQYSVPGVPKFAEGEEYVVFLAGVSSLGFSSPIGLQQGRFHLKRDGGQRTVANGRDFADMLTHLSDRVPEAVRARLAQLPREMDLADFKALVRDRVGGRP
jgi:hypothetical protein